MKIISRYILREHIGPFVFAFTALTSLMLLNFISRQLGDLVGKGLPWSAIMQFFLLAFPFTIALTLPMSVLVAVLYAFSRLAAENEVTAMKASGVSPWRLVAPALSSGVVMSLLLLAFNDQVLPRANHQLKNLQDDISQTKPTLLLKDQVINPIAEGRLYLKADKIDQAGSRLTRVVIYDLTNPMRRRTIYADSGHIAFAANRVDLDMNLYDGQMLEVATENPGQLDRMFYRQDRIRIRDVGRDFKKTAADSTARGDREMSICEMQRRFWAHEQGYQNTIREIQRQATPQETATSLPPVVKVPEPRGLGWGYCKLLELAIPRVKELQAADLPARRAEGQDAARKDAARQDTARQDTARQDTARQDTARQDTARRPVVAPLPEGAQTATPQPAPGTFTPAAPPAQDTQAARKTQEQIAAQAAAEMMRNAQKAVVAEPPPAPAGVPASLGLGSRGIENQMRLQIAQRARNRYDIEIHKKFSLAAACLIFCVLAPPIALRFPRGGVGLVIGVSLVVFALYYVGLIGGEGLANKGIVHPFWAMWSTNILMTLVGIVMLLRIGRETGSVRGGGFREWLDTRRMLRAERRAAASAGRGS